MEKTEKNQELIDLEDISNESLKIETDGKEMLVEFDFAAIKFIAKQTGLGRYEFYNKFITNKLTDEEVEILILAGLLRHQPDLTLDDINKFTGYFEGIVKTIAQAYVKIFIQPEIYHQIYFPEDDKKNNEENSEEKKLQSQTKPTGAEI